MVEDEIRPSLVGVVLGLAVAVRVIAVFVPVRRAALVDPAELLRD